MDVKELFANAEDGKLSYDEFIKLASDNKAKIVDLSEGNYVSKQKYEDELKTRDTRISDLNTTVTERENDLATLKGQLETAGTDATKLADVSKDLTDLQAKYDKETKAYQKQLAEQAYDFAVKEFVAKQKFSSEAAKREFTSQMKSKKLQMEGDTIIGATDFLEKYKADNEDAFKIETPDNSGSMDKPKPKFVDSTKSTQSNAEANPFQFNFTGVRPH